MSSISVPCDRSGTSNQSCHYYYYLQARHSALPSAFQCRRKACLPPCLHVNNAPEGERQKSVSRSSLVCHLPSPCISPDRQAPLKTGGGVGCRTETTETPRISLAQKHEYFTYLHPRSPSPISSPLILRLSAFAFHMPGWLGDAAPCNSSRAQATEAVAMAIWHRGIFFPSAFFIFFSLSHFPPTFNDAAACLGSVYSSVQLHDSDLLGLCACVGFILVCVRAHMCVWDFCSGELTNVRRARGLLAGSYIAPRLSLSFAVHWTLKHLTFLFFLSFVILFVLSQLLIPDSRLRLNLR